MTILSLAIQKGGSGKTTSTINLGAALRQMGFSVLLVDLDPQANLTQALGLPDHLSPNIYHLLKQEAMGETSEAGTVITVASGLPLLPAALDLADAEMELVSTFGREKLLTQVLANLPQAYDFVLIDCPPSVGMLTINALTASDFVLMPLQAEFLPLKGVQSFLRAFTRVQRQLNPKLALLGLFVTRFDARKTMNREVMAQLQAQFGEQVLPVHIRTNIALAEAQQAGKDIFAYDPTANGALDYLRLAENVLKRLLGRP